MISLILIVLISVGLLCLLMGLPWAIVYLPGTQEDHDWLKYVTDRTKYGFLHWDYKQNEYSSHKDLVGVDVAKQEFHELSIHDFSNRFLRSYSYTKAPDGLKYTHQMKQLAYISIKPWAPLKKLADLALEQIKKGDYLPVMEEAPPTIEQRSPLFGLAWGEEPEWAKHNNKTED